MGAFPTAPPGPGAGGPPPSITPVPPGGAPSRYEPQLKQIESREAADPNKAPRIQLYAPEPVEKDLPKPTEEPPVNKKGSSLSSLPPIAQFAVAKDNVFAGLSPKHDGLDWLQDKDVQTIIHISLVGTPESDTRAHVEKRKMQYVSFSVSPQTLTKEKADEFVKLIRDNAKQGIFVYDQDGSLAGSMWYLYLRFGEVLDDDAAQLRARQLGLQTDRDGPHRDMWLAVQKVLSENSK